MTADLFAIIGVGIALAGLILYLARGMNEMRRDIGALRENMIRENAGLREQMHREIAGLRDQTHREIAGLREQMHRENADLRERMARLEGLFEGFAGRKSDKPE